MPALGPQRADVMSPDRGVPYDVLAEAGIEGDDVGIGIRNRLEA